VPELPEVETTRRGLAPHLDGRRIRRVIVREPRLRRRIPASLPGRLGGARITGLHRRAKYLLLETDRGTALIHLGMSGSLRVAPPGSAPARHEHYDLVLDDGRIVRYRDPRRFGMLLWAGTHPESHPLLRAIGPEPLGDAFDGGRLYAASRGRRAAVKTFLMNPAVVAGVGNIYANEALFRAGIHPRRPAGRVGADRYANLAAAVRAVLAEAIAHGGTTLRDFVAGDGTPGYFRIRLDVYDREGLPCRRCGQPLRRAVIGQRSTFYCPRCQR